jgi:hypothetical protein
VIFTLLDVALRVPAKGQLTLKAVWLKPLLKNNILAKTNM